MIVLKFGGSSVRDAEWIDRVVSIAATYLDDAPVLVASAMGKTTDALLRVTEAAERGDHAAAREEIAKIRVHHLSTASAALSGVNHAETVARITAFLDDLSLLVQGVSLIRECSPRTRDAVLSYGELLSTTLIAARSRERGITTTLLDSRDFIKTDETFTNATVLFAETNDAIRRLVTPRRGELFVAQGFIGSTGSTGSGVTTTLGRGGSDYSATIIGAALGASEVQIWTDVDGIMTTDPRIIPGAVTVASLTYDEAGELAYFGAKVVHPFTIHPAVELGIPVVVKNTGNPEAAGTRVSDSTETSGLKAIARKTGVVVVTIHSSRMVNAYGFLSRIFRVFEEYRVSVDLIATSEVSVSVTIEDTPRIAAIARDLERLGRVEVERDRGIICLVGRELWKDSAFVARVFAVLTEVPIRMITLGSSDTNLSLVVPDANTETAIRLLHAEFFGRA